MSLTIKELADDLGVSKTAIRKYFTPEFRDKYVIEEQGVLYIRNDGVNLIKNHKKEKAMRNPMRNTIGNPLEIHKTSDMEVETANQFAETKPETTNQFAETKVETTNQFAETKVETTNQFAETKVETTNQFAETKVETANQEVNKIDAEIINVLKQTIETLQRQLEIKDKQIADLTDANNHLAQSINADRHNELAGTMQQFLPVGESEKKKGFFAKLFGR